MRGLDKRGFTCRGLLLQIVLVFTFISRNRVTSVTSPASLSRPAMKECRDRLGVFPQPLFTLHACAKCLDYLLPDGTGAFEVFNNRFNGLALLRSNISKDIVWAEPRNRTAMGLVCDTLKSEDCVDWTTCCESAEECCQKQVNLTFLSTTTAEIGCSPNSDDSSTDRGQCPMTWDGYSCVDKTPAGQTAVIQCPAFITRFSSDISGSASRQCWPNASWFVNDAGLEWTNYESCHKTQDHQTILNLKLAFKGVSLALLVPSIAIFLIFRQLRSQLRVKIHINLFLSLTLTALFSLLWEAIVSRDLLDTGQTDYFIETHQAACKFLNITSRWLLMATFFWMFCEGFYLTWLMLQSFKHLSSMLGFCLFGWGVPVIFCIIYIIVRVTVDEDGQCWLTSAGHLEWIIDGPTVACIGMNLLFLVAIMRVMVRQLQSHNEEQSVVRRSLRALVILIPLFGLQQFCILYRPDPSHSGFYVYEVASAAIINLQGAVVALIFCFFNGEVQGHLKGVYRRLQYKLGVRRHQSRQSMSVTSSMQPRLSRPSLASIDTVASVVLAPVHLTTTSSNSNGASDGRDERSSDGGSWRIRIATLQDSIAEHERESDETSSMNNSDLNASSVTDEIVSPSQTHLSVQNDCVPDSKCTVDSFRSGKEAAHVGDETEPGTKDGKCCGGQMTTKKKQWSVFSKVLCKVSKFNSRTTKDRTFEGGRISKVGSAHSATCTPDIVVSRDGEVMSHHALPQYKANTSSDILNGVLHHNKNTRVCLQIQCTDNTDDFSENDNSSFASADDRSSSKCSVDGDDADTSNLVQTTFSNADGDTDVILRHSSNSNRAHDVHHNSGHHSFAVSLRPVHDSHKRVHHTTSSANDDTRQLCDASSLQASSSTASFSSSNTAAPSESERSSMTETEDSGNVSVPVGEDMTSQHCERKQGRHGFYFVNHAFKAN